MDWTDFLTALGLAAMIEGILYAAFPEGAKQAMTEFMSMATEQRRKIALAIAAFGFVLIWLVRG